MRQHIFTLIAATALIAHIYRLVGTATLTFHVPALVIVFVILVTFLWVILPKLDDSHRAVVGTDVFVHVLFGSYVGTLSAWTMGYDQTSMLLTLVVVIFARCTSVASRWVEAAGATLCGWLAALICLTQTQALFIPQTALPPAKFALLQLLLLAISSLAIYVAYRLETLRILETYARGKGRYVIQDRLGQGGNGQVFRAWDAHLERHCAIKILHNEDTVHDAVLDRFEREIRTTSMLSSPYVVSVHDYGVTENQRPYFVMEYLDGIDLKTLIRRETPFSPTRALRLMLQVTHVLEEAHSKGIVHCDVKPSNLMVMGQEPNDVIKLVDFGFAQAKHHPEMPKTFVHGTAGYVAPERLLGQTGSPRSDVYAVGSVLYFMLTGYAAFIGPSPVSISRSQLNTTPPQPSALQHELPPAVDRMILRCLEIDPQRRYPSMTHLRRVMQQVLQQIESTS